MNERLDDFMALASRNVFQPLYGLIRGHGTSRYMRDVRRVMPLPVEQMRAHQQARLRRVVAAALKTPWYGRTLREAGVGSAEDVSLDSLKRLPLIAKQDIRAHGDSFLNPDVLKRDMVLSATGGTTETPLPLAIDASSYLRRWAVTSYFDQTIGIAPGEKSVRLWGAPQDYSRSPSPWRRLRNSLLQRTLYLPSSPLDDAILAAHVRAVKEYRPKHLVSYPTPLGILAEYMLREGIGIPLKTVSCCAEPLLPHTRSVIEQAFGLKVFDWYGAREAGRIATECHRRHGMHVNSYGLIVETLQASGNGPGEVVLTDLYNVAMPMIRYRIGDLARLSDDPCPCGSELPRLFDLSGRIMDCFVNSKGQFIPVIGHSGHFLFDNTKIKKLQIIQRGYADFEMLLVPGPEHGEDTFHELRRRLDRFMMQANAVVFTLVEDIPPTPSGKTVLCRRAFQAEAQPTPVSRATPPVAPQECAP